MKYSIIYWVLIAFVLGLIALPRFIEIGEREQAQKRVQVSPAAITTFDGVDAKGDSVKLLKVPVHYDLRDSAAAVVKIWGALAMWFQENPWTSIARNCYEYRDEYFENDSTTIVVAEYYVIEPTPVGYK